MIRSGFIKRLFILCFMELNTRRLSFMNKRAFCSFFYFIFFVFSVFALLTTTNTTTLSLGTRCPLTGKADFHFQELEKSFHKTTGEKIVAYETGTRSGRRLLGGPGSSPPRCSSKCGRCTPCKPVHVTVPPGTPVTAEYYPEAWRCKCGNKLYMP